MNNKTHYKLIAAIITLLSYPAHAHELKHVLSDADIAATTCDYNDKPLTYSEQRGNAHILSTTLQAATIAEQRLHLKIAHNIIPTVSHTQPRLSVSPFVQTASNQADILVEHIQLKPLAQGEQYTAKTFHTE